MIIYRIEDRKGRGPYPVSQQTEMAWRLAEDHHNKPSATLIEGWKFGMVCGFDSFDKMISWFDNWLDFLLDNGFDIVEYDVDNYVSDGLQVAFYK